MSLSATDVFPHGFATLDSPASNNSVSQMTAHYLDLASPQRIQSDRQVEEDLCPACGARRTRRDEEEINHDNNITPSSTPACDCLDSAQATSLQHEPTSSRRQANKGKRLKPRLRAPMLSTSSPRFPSTRGGHFGGKDRRHRRTASMKRATGDTRQRLQAIAASENNWDQGEGTFRDSKFNRSDHDRDGVTRNDAEPPETERFVETARPEQAVDEEYDHDEILLLENDPSGSEEVFVKEKTRFPEVSVTGSMIGAPKMDAVSDSFRKMSLHGSASMKRQLSGMSDQQELRLPAIGVDPPTRSRMSRAPPSDMRPKSDDQLVRSPVTWFRYKDPDHIQYKLRVAEETGQWEGVVECYRNLFSSLLSISTSFSIPSSGRRRESECNIDFDKLIAVYKSLDRKLSNAGEIVMRLIGALLTGRSGKASRQDLVAFYCLLLNPQFQDAGLTSYSAFADLLRHVADLDDYQNRIMVQWFIGLDPTEFRHLLMRIQQFITCRYMSCDDTFLPPVSKTPWWIPNAIRVMALLNAANCLSKPPIVSYTEFYNCSLDNVDLQQEYNLWQDSSNQDPNSFNICQFPFVLSLAAKRDIIQKDSANQMILMARRTVVAKLKKQQTADMNQLFLNITVRRSHLVSDSLNEIAQKEKDLKKKIRVRFANEPGLDMGGLTKEWFLLLVRQIFLPDYGMFTFNKQSQVYWFSATSSENYLEYNLIGILMGLAVYNGIILDIHFPPICYKKLLSPAVVPYYDVNAVVGVLPVTLDDLRQMSPDVADGLQGLLDYEGDVEGDFGLTFEVTVCEFGAIISHELKPGGKDTPVTSRNRREYVSLYVDYILNTSIYDQFKAFYHGFHSVCASNALIMLRPEEVESLVCGNTEFSIKRLAQVAEYNGYKAGDRTIRYFWEVVQTMPEELQKKLLLFTTGSDRIPIGGMDEMCFRIVYAKNSQMLPSSHTCFNQLVLPDYRDRKVLRHKLTIAIQNAEGFGMQ